MKIAVDTRQLRENHLQEDRYFLQEVLKRIINKNPGHEFVFIFDRPYDAKFLFDKNITAVITSPRVSNHLLAKFWYDIKIPALLKKHKADVFIAGNGMCSLTTKCPQCLVINDLSFLYHPSFIKKTDLFFFKRYTKRFLQKADSIVTFSEILQKRILSLNAIKKEKIIIVRGAAREVFYPVSESEKEETKKKYTDGKNYFVYIGTIQPQKNLINLLKAFSVFKKRQKSDWKLVLAGSTTPGYKNFSDKLKTYKHRADVVTISANEGEAPELIGSAYAFIFPSFGEGLGTQILGAMNSHIPVITSENSAMQEIAGDAALYINPAEHKDIADKMMLLYKDETLRNNLIEKGKLVAAHYTWEKAADLFWQSILKAIK
ncbi:MAG TPA: glycosyltransferase family 1 protein [Chitinophagaceae bacterium]|nr:glycosyltransferase family 1 protein [Chitinophagaceae bacterium]